MITGFYISIPTWENENWSYTDFETREAYRDFVISCFKEPGLYEFDETSFEFNLQARRFRKNKDVYCIHPYKSADFVKYWDGEKEKCRRGVIYKNNRKTWYLTRDYYMWLNFLPIFDKEQNKFDFAKVRDAQYHMCLYELLAELHHLHSAVLKKRQIASSYLHTAKLVNQIWFEEGVTLKMGAYNKDKINKKGSWAFLEEYRDFLNAHTAWYRPMNPGKELNWEQKIDEKKGTTKRWGAIGLKGRLLGMSFEQDASNGVGGPCKYFFYEEGGIAPTADESYIYIRQAMRSGMITTGMFIIAGAVGDLDHCEPLKKFVLNPTGNSIYPVSSNLVDHTGTTAMTGLFIPEQWSMPPYIDKYGNSLVKEALEALDKEFTRLKKEMSPEDYQLEVSQRPRTIEEAFAYRKESKFPTHLLQAQKKRIEDKEYGKEFLEIYRDAQGVPAVKETNRLPITDFPVKKNQEDKEGVVVVWERPMKDPSFGQYYASIDPVSEGKTVTSESLCSIYIWKNDIQITRVKPDGSSETFIEHGRIVAAWCGRFDDIRKTHERLSLILEWYNAWAVVENNISLFIQYMIEKRKQKYLVPKSQIMFLKDIGANQNVYQDYGWRNTGTVFRSHLLSYAIEALKEELDVETKTDGTIVKVKFGIERIPDPMLITEMLEYHDNLNVDRLVAFSALMAFVKIQQSNRGYIKRVEEEGTGLEKSPKFAKLVKSPFSNMGKSGRGSRPNRGYFKNIR